MDVASKRCSRACGSGASFQLTHDQAAIGIVGSTLGDAAAEACHLQLPVYFLFYKQHFAFVLLRACGAGQSKLSYIGSMAPSRLLTM